MHEQREREKEKGKNEVVKNILRIEKIFETNENWGVKS